MSMIAKDGTNSHSRLLQNPRYIMRLERPPPFADKYSKIGTKIDAIGGIRLCLTIGKLKDNILSLALVI